MSGHDLIRLELWEICTARKRKDVIHSIFSRYDEIKKSVQTGRQTGKFRKILLATVEQEKAEERWWSGKICQSDSYRGEFIAQFPRGCISRIYLSSGSGMRPKCPYLWPMNRLSL